MSIWEKENENIMPSFLALETWNVIMVLTKKKWNQGLKRDYK